MAKRITGKFYSQDGERSIPMPGPVIYDMDLTIRSGEWWGIQLLMEQWEVWNTVLAVDSTDLHRTAHPWRASPTPPTTPGASGFRKDRKSTRLNSSHVAISYAVFCLKKKKSRQHVTTTQDAE